jgi:DNA helicase-2/ATP-dependent DNA helicase PcrA
MPKTWVIIALMRLDFLSAKYLERLHQSGQADLYSVSRDCALKVNDGSIPPLPYTDMLVDEGQDTDDIQRVWIFAHARAGTRVCIVGDDDQSIYEWRHALGFSGMKSFLDAFQATRIELGDNFRCRSEILDHAGILISNNRARLGKNLVARRGSGGVIFAVRSASPEAECDHLAQLVASSPKQHTNAVVLSRRNRSLDVLEMAFRSRGIDYKRIGASIWNDALISGYLAFLQTLLDGSSVGILAIANNRGIADATRAQLMSKITANPDQFLDGHMPEMSNLSEIERKPVEALSQDCAYWRRQLRASSVNEVVLEVGEVFSGFTRSTPRKDLMLMCARILSEMRGTLSSRLRTVSTRNRDISQESIVLMTMHGSKGLEFETVHIMDARDSKDMSDLIDLEPERRLMYVGMTRAKERCVVWFSGDPHFSIAESQLPIKHLAADVRALFEH